MHICASAETRVPAHSLGTWSRKRVHIVVPLVSVIPRIPSIQRMYIYVCACLHIYIYIYVFTYIHIQTTLLESSRFAENTFTLVSRSYSVRSSPIGRWIAVDREIDQQLPSGSLTGILRSNLNLSSRLNYSQGYDNYYRESERERD